MSTTMTHLHRQAKHRAAEIAVLSVNGEVWTFDALWRGLERLASQIQGLGIQRQQRVAVVLPSGPQAAHTILSVSSVAICVPLSPRYRQDEYTRYFSHLAIDALIVGPEQGAEARRAAAAAGIPVMKLTAGSKAPAAIAGAEQYAGSQPSWSSATDVAFLIHTSGTTSRPKQVLLTHYNVLYSASNIARSVQLTPDDRSLSVVPLYHVSGLISSMIAPLISGSSVVCTPGFSAPTFVARLADFDCTWSTAVPNMYQTLLAWLKHAGEQPQPSRLRFLRSGAASLPPATMAALEENFKVPVLDVYGMTETTSGIVGNPMPPRPRKPGSVGLSYGPDLAVLGEDGAITAEPGVSGEILARGECVITAYGGPREETAHAFVDGWLRTGDLGHFDEDGYLFITGRRRELINRGGENIAPREVDEALLTHPAVAQALAFGVPDSRLGETVAAVVVVHQQMEVSAAALQQHVAQHLTEFKIPHPIIFLDELPTGSTGKPQRIGLARKLGLDTPVAALQETPGETALQPPRTELEAMLAEIWRDVLHVETLGINSPFMDLGGDSLAAMRLLALMEERLDRRLPASLIFHAKTIAELAQAVQRTERAGAADLVLQPVQVRGTRPPFFYVHGVFGDLLNLSNVIPHLPPDQPVYGLEAIGLHPGHTPDTTIESMAARYVHAVRRVQPDGPYLLGGYCFGGVVAYEMARQFSQMDAEVALVAIIDGSAPRQHQRPQPLLHAERLDVIRRSLPYWLNGNREFGGWVMQRRRRGQADQVNSTDPSGASVDQSNLADFAAERPEIQHRLKTTNVAAIRQYRPEPYPGQITLIRARALHLTHALFGPLDVYRGWRDLAGGGVSLRFAGGHHTSILQEPNAAELARVLTESMDAARPETVRNDSAPLPEPAQGNPAFDKLSPRER